MQKKRYWPPFREPRNRVLIKIFQVMRLTAFLLTVMLMQVHASTSAQHITLSGEEMTFDHIFHSIKKQTGYGVLYDEHMFSSQKKRSLTVSNMPLADFLDTLLHNENITYYIEGKVIFLTRKAPIPYTFDDFPVKIRVVDSTGTPLAGASVTNKQTKVSGITDADGKLELKVSVGDVLLVSFVGMEPYSIKVIESFRSGTIVSVVLKPVVSTLNEVEIVSTGYWTQSKERSVANISKVTSKDIERQPVTNPLMALQGRMAGVDVSPTSGAPGGAIKIQIRGQNSIRGTTGDYPLYVIDGVPIDPVPLSTSSYAAFSDGFDPLSTLNPANIESIEVLKDAAATSIYGSRGANGVVLITTKSFHGEKTSLDVNAYTGFGKVPHFLDLLNTEQYLAIRKEAMANDGVSPEWYDIDVNGTWDNTRYTDWQKLLLGNTSRINDAQLGLSGGNRTTSYRFSGAYHTEGTVLLNKDFGLRSISGALSVNHTSNNRKFTASFTVNYGSSLNKLFNDNSVLSAALSLPPNAPELFRPNGELNWEMMDTPFGLMESWTNPYAPLTREHETRTGQLITSATFRYNIFKGLSVIARQGFSTLSSSEMLTSPFSSLQPSTISSLTTVSTYYGENKRQTWSFEPQLQYVREFGDHKLEVNAGMTWQENRGLFQSLLASGYTSDALITSLRAATGVIINADDNSQYRYTAGFGRVGYSYMDKYLLDLSVRRDGSSRFGPENRFGNFGAVGAGWIFSKEPIFSSQSILSFGKIRASYGLTGNDQIGNYSFLNTYGITIGHFQNAITIVPSSLFNPTLVWEQTKKLETALELAFLDNRLALEVAAFRNRSSNQIVNRALPFSTGFSSISDNFDAVVQNTGLELLLNTRNIVKRHFSWSTSANISFLRNKLIEFKDIENSTFYQRVYKVGEPLSAMRHYIWTGVDPQTGLHTFKDLNNNGVTDDDDMAFSSALTRGFFGGLNNNFSIGRFELSVLFQFVKQLAFKQYIGLAGGLGNVSTYVLDRWQKPGDITSVSRLNSDYSTSGNTSDAINSTYGVEDASFIRLKTLSASYNVDSRLLNRLGLERLQLFFQGQNLLTFTRSKNLDPETGNSLPPLRMFNFGLQIKL